MITKLMTLYKDYNKDLTSTGSKIYRDRHGKLSKKYKKNSIIYLQVVFPINIKYILVSTIKNSEVRNVLI